MRECVGARVSEVVGACVRECMMVRECACVRASVFVRAYINTGLNIFVRASLPGT